MSASVPAFLTEVAVRIAQHQDRYGRKIGVRILRMPDIEAEYRRRIDALTPAERIARMAAMASWARDIVGRRIRREREDDMSDAELAWRVCFEIYRDEPVAELIRKRIERCEEDGVWDRSMPSNGPST